MPHTKIEIKNIGDNLYISATFPFERTERCETIALRHAEACETIRVSSYLNIGECDVYIIGKPDVALAVLNLMRQPKQNTK